MIDQHAGNFNFSRRSAIAGGTAAFAALALARSRATARQDASPVSDSEGTPPAGGGSLLFVQSFSAASIAPATGDPGMLTLTLERDAGRTLYFSDRPERIVGIVETATFVQEFGAETAADPANAAVVSRDDHGEEAIIVVELLDLSYDETTNTATYSTRLLEDAGELGLGFFGAPQQSVTGEQRFGPSQLFIDAGGLMQLVAYGAQDVYLDGPPIGTQ